MAIYGIGAWYDRDVSQDFKNHHIVGTGWNVHEAPDLHEYFRILEHGDIVYLKSASFGRPVTIKGIGLIDDTAPTSGKFGSTRIETGRSVRWLDKSVFQPAPVFGKNNVRSNTMYRETHPDMIAVIMHIVQQKLKNL